MVSSSAAGPLTDELSMNWNLLMKLTETDELSINWNLLQFVIYVITYYITYYIIFPSDNVRTKTRKRKKRKTEETSSE